MNKIQGNNYSISPFGRSNKHAALEEMQKRKRDIISSTFYFDSAYAHPKSDFISDSKFSKTVLPDEKANNEEKWSKDYCQSCVSVFGRDLESRKTVDSENADSLLVKLEDSISDTSLQNFTMSDDEKSTYDHETVSLSCWDSDIDNTFDVCNENRYSSIERISRTRTNSSDIDDQGSIHSRDNVGAIVGPDSKQMQVIHQMLEFLDTNKLQNNEYPTYILEIELIVKQCTELHMIDVREYRHLPGSVFDKLVAKLGGEIFLRIYMESKSFEICDYR